MVNRRRSDSPFLFVKNNFYFFLFLCYKHQTYSFSFMNELKNSKNGS